MGVIELALSLYLNNLHLIVLIGFILALCTVGPILIVSGPFIAKPMFKKVILNISFEFEKSIF